MAFPSANLASRSGNLVESHTSFQPRVVVFHLLVLGLLLTLGTGLGIQQLVKNPEYRESERMQNQRRIVVPGPRGVIFDREGRLLVGNHPRFAAVIYLDELRKEFRQAYIQVRKNYRASGDKDIPSSYQMEMIARSSVVQGYLDQINKIIGRQLQVNVNKLQEHFSQELLIPFTLVNDLSPEEYARLIERLPVKSPLQVTTNSVRYYPFGRMAQHTLGSVSINTEGSGADQLPGADLPGTFKVAGPVGKDGLEKQFDAQLVGQPGGTIFRVEPAGYRINPPLEKRLPVQGKNITTSLDVDLQLVAEESLGDMTGAAVMMDVNSGEVLVLASKPDFADGAWLNRALSGLYMPGSTFKLMTAIAAFRKGTLDADSVYTTNGTFVLNRKVFRDHGGCITGDIDFRTAVEHSVNTYFMHYGVMTGVDSIAAESVRFGLDRPTGIELPYEVKRMMVGTPEWKKKRIKENWFPGDTANLSIGQGYIMVTPLQMACFAASLARGQTTTKPTLLHQEKPVRQESEPIGITPEQYKALLEGMGRVVSSDGGSGRFARVDGLPIAGKTGTAQFRTPKGTLELAWFIGFAPIERPEVAFAVLVEGDTPDESFAGGRYAGPVARAILEKWWEKKRNAPPPKIGK